MSGQIPAHPPHKSSPATPRWAWWRRALAALAIVLFAVPKVVWRSLVIAYFVLATVFLLLGYVVAPQIEARKDDIAQAIGTQLGLRVVIGGLQADWHGLRPRLDLQAVKVFDSSQRLVLELPVVRASVAWVSLLKWQPHLYSLELSRPDLALRRDASGRIFVAGLEIKPQAGDDPSVADFLLAQREILIHEARLSWLDEQRAAPLIVLDKLSLRLNNSGDKHAFAALASPPAHMAAQIELRGDLRGRSLSQLESWRGTLFLDAQRFDLAAWTPWVDYPLELPRGRGGLVAWLNFEGLRIGSLTTDFALSDLHLRLAADLPLLDMAQASGRLRFAAREGDFSLAMERVQLQTVEGVRLAPTSFSLSHETARKERPESGELRAEALDLGVLGQLAGSLPLPAAAREKLVLLEPRGVVVRSHANWKGPLDAPLEFSFDTRFENLAWRPLGNAPGVEGLSGTLSGSEREGKYQLGVKDGGLWLPALMPVPFTPLNEASAEGSWSRPASTAGKPQPLSVKLKQLQLRTPDVAVEAQGVWRGLPGSSGHLDMTAKAHSGVGSEAWKYVPKVVVGLPEWLHENLKSGVGERASMRLVGDLARFPFIDPAHGEFRVDVDVRDATLDFAHGWPGLTGVRAKLLFERQLMRISSNEARFGAVKVRNVLLEIPNLMEEGRQVMTVKGQATGPLPDFQRYVHASALNETIGPFTRGLEAQGNGDLDLQLSIPMHAMAHSQVRGNFRFARSQLRLIPALPLLQDATANIAFTEQSFSMADASATFLGARVKASGAQEADGQQRFVAEGVLPARNLGEIVRSPLWAALEGSTPAKATILVRKSGVDVAVESQLRGLRSRLPAPLDKAADTARPLFFGWQSPATGNALQTWRVRLEPGIEAQWQDRCEVDSCQFQRGAVVVGDALSLPERGWRFSGRFVRLDVDAWLGALKGSTGGAPRSEAMPLAGVALNADEIVWAGYRFRRVAARATGQDERWTLRVDGPDLTGDLRYSSVGAGTVHARLSRLVLSSAAEEGAGLYRKPNEETADLPALDVQAEQFQLRGLDMGRLELRANNRGGDWWLEKIDVSNPDFSLRGDGAWKRAGNARSESAFNLTLNTPDAGEALGRLGHPNALRQGNAEFKGQISWAGAPTSLDYSSLNGSLHLEANKGQFAKVDTGLGRLLGVLSLQALPRRVTLDFRDVFSEGFAFDTMRADVSIANGVMKTQNLEIRGPAARVLMHGSTDLGKETHDLRIEIQPALSEIVALGAVGVGVINPAVGVAAYLAQKAMRDPVEKLFGFNYTVSGSWADPKIDKVSGPTSTAESAPAAGEK